VAELTKLADDRGVTVAAPVSLKTQLSRWENQHAIPEEHYRVLLCALYESTEFELGLAIPIPADEPRPTERDRLKTELTRTSDLDEAVIRLLEAQMRSTRQLDRRLGAAATSGSALAQLSHLERAKRHAVLDQTRRRLAGLVVDAAGLAGDHALDQLRYTDAWQHFETVRLAAQDAEATVLVGYAMVRQASVLLELGEHRLAVELTEQAVAKNGSGTPGNVLAWFAVSQGRARASTGDSSLARSAYRLAERQLRESPPVIDINYPASAILAFDLDSFRRHRGHTRLLMREEVAAIEDLEQTLSVDTSARDLAAVHVDLAHACRAIGRADSAAEHAGRAREIVQRIGSPRLAAQLDDPRPAEAPDSVRMC
jgi:tetratricopeptide (TPR) repeat protein